MFTMSRKDVKHVNWLSLEGVTKFHENSLGIDSVNAVKRNDSFVLFRSRFHSLSVNRWENIFISAYKFILLLKRIHGIRDQAYVA